MVDTRTRLGIVIRTQREAKRLSQQALADSVGMSKTYLLQVEHGRVDASLHVYLAIAKGLDTDLAILLREADMVDLGPQEADLHVTNGDCWCDPEVVTVPPPPLGIPDRFAVDARGYAWRVWDDHPTFWSMACITDDNEPIPTPITWFVRDPDGPTGIVYTQLVAEQDPPPAASSPERSADGV